MASDDHVYVLDACDSLFERVGELGGAPAVDEFGPKDNTRLRPNDTLS